MLNETNIGQIFAPKSLTIRYAGTKFSSENGRIDFDRSVRNQKKCFKSFQFKILKTRTIVGFCILSLARKCCFVVQALIYLSE